MSDISASFVVQYQAEVMAAYQRGGSKLRNTVRLQTGVVGASTMFNKIGSIEAGQKSQRHGDVPTTDAGHAQAKCDISDWYAASYIDKLDEAKITYDERRALGEAGAYAVGRKMDDLIIAAACASSGLPPANVIGDGSKPVSLDMVMSAYEALNNGDVPDDGQRYVIVNPGVWNGLLRIKQFASSEYAGQSYPWLKGTETRKYLNMVWMMHTGLPSSGSGDAKQVSCLMYHQTALGLAENGKGIISEINYVPTKAAFLANNMIGAGACRIDPKGVVVFKPKATGFVPEPEFAVQVSP